MTVNGGRGWRGVCPRIRDESLDRGVISQQDARPVPSPQNDVRELEVLVEDREEGGGRRRGGEEGEKGRVRRVGRGRRNRRYKGRNNVLLAFLPSARLVSSSRNPDHLRQFLPQDYYIVFCRNPCVPPIPRNKKMYELYRTSSDFFHLVLMNSPQILSPRF